MGKVVNTRTVYNKRQFVMALNMEMKINRFTDVGETTVQYVFNDLYKKAKGSFERMEKLLSIELNCDCFYAFMQGIFRFKKKEIKI